MQRTTIALPAALRDRLQTYGRKGMSYAEILERLMDSVDRRRFLADIEDGIERPIPSLGASVRPPGRVAARQRQTPQQALAMAEALRRQAAGMNPEGVRRVVESRLRAR